MEILFRGAARRELVLSRWRFARWWVRREERLDWNMYFCDRQCQDAQRGGDMETYEDIRRMKANMSPLSQYSRNSLYKTLFLLSNRPTIPCPVSCRIDCTIRTTWADLAPSRSFNRLLSVKLSLSWLCFTTTYSTWRFSSVLSQSPTIP